MKIIVNVHSALTYKMTENVKKSWEYTWEIGNNLKIQIMLLLPILSARLLQSLCYWNSKIFRYCANHPNMLVALRRFLFSLTSFCWTQKMLKSCIAFLFKHHIRTLVTYKYNLNYVLLPVHLRCLICPHLPFMMLASVKFLFTIKRNSKYHLANSNICKQNEDKFWMHGELIRNMWPKYQLVIIP